MVHTSDAENDPSLLHLIAHAEMVLSAAWKGTVHLARPECLPSRNLVVRCAVVTAPSGTAASLVIKRVHMDGYDPNQVGTTASALFNEWAGLQFLSEFGRIPALGPTLYGGDRAAGFTVLEDLGATQTLAITLKEPDSRRAARALQQFSTLLGQMHAATVGREEEFRRLRDVLGPREASSEVQGEAPLRQSIGHLSAVLARINIEPEPAFYREIAMVLDALDTPGPFWTYTHGDPCPLNCLHVGPALRLIDYEFGGYRHALIDGVSWFMIFPTCMHGGLLPAHLVGQMEAAYRQALATGCPAARNDTLYHQAVVVACAFWTLKWLIEPIEWVLESDRRWGNATLRQRILARLQAFVRISEERQHMPAIRRTAVQVREELGNRWAAETGEMPYYRAFQ